MRIRLISLDFPDFENLGNLNFTVQTPIFFYVVVFINVLIFLLSLIAFLKDFLYL